MKKSLRRLYKESISNTEFKDDVKIKDPEGYAEPNMFSPEFHKIIFVSAYYGWLIAKGKYKRSNYDY